MKIESTSTRLVEKKKIKHSNVITLLMMGCDILIPPVQKNVFDMLRN
jgi:hypothetical protein